MRKLLLFPVRLAVGWGWSPRLLSVLAVAMLVLLRMSIGWHFLSEGRDKIDNGNWSAAPFFANSKGPFASEFRKFVWDADGQFRLDRDAMLYNLALYRDRVGQHYGFDENQQAAAQANYSSAVKQYEWVIADNQNEIEEFERGRERVARLADDPWESQLRDGVASLGEQRDTIRREWLATGRPVLNQIDTIWQTYEQTQNDVATADQTAARSYYRLSKPRTNFVDTSVMDRLVPWFDFTVGCCLLLGLFTPVAALAAAGFLASVFVSQLPPSTGPTSTSYQLIECMACLVVASTGAGRFAGLDYFIHLFCRMVWRQPKTDPPS